MEKNIFLGGPVMIQGGVISVKGAQLSCVLGYTGVNPMHTSI